MATATSIGLMSLDRPWHTERLAALQQVSEVISPLFGTSELTPELMLAFEAAFREVTLTLPASRTFRARIVDFVRTALATNDLHGLQEELRRACQVAEVTAHVILNLEDAKSKPVLPEPAAIRDRYLAVQYDMHEIWTEVERVLLKGHTVLMHRQR